MLRVRFNLVSILLLTASIALAGCSSGSGGGNPVDGDPDGGTDRRDSGNDEEDSGREPVETRFRDQDDTGVYDNPGGDPDPDICTEDDRVYPDCFEELDENAADLCNGSDDDCDGDVDEGCPCEVGDVQRCFNGPPGYRGVGACDEGQQRCEDSGSEFAGEWGPCNGGIAPSTEVCDDLDNDCNGCSDELPECDPEGSCPGPNDPRVTDGEPFSTYVLNGRDFYDMDDVTSWRWEVKGTPCDELFMSIPGSNATPENGELSYTLRNADQEEAEIDFTLSGDYEVTMNVERDGGEDFSCTWIVHVRADGLRVELCWDETGPTADDPVDVDLHLGKIGTTTEWFDSTTDCHYSNCKSSGSLDWGYGDSPIENCTGPGARGNFSGSCPNPRLDIDNISQTDAYVPENINLDNPEDEDRFRVMVHHFDNTDIPTKPIVNVYCGGELRGSYGAPPDDVQNFMNGGGRNGGDMWRVADVEMIVTGAGEDCDLTPIYPPGTGMGYYITTDDSAF